MATTIIKSTDSDNQAKVDSTGHLYVTDGGTPIQVTGTMVTGGSFSALSPGYPTQITVGTASTTLFPSNSARKYVHIVNNSSAAIFIQYQATAALNQGVKIAPGGFFTLDVDNLWLGAINAIGLMSGQLIDVLEGI